MLARKWKPWAELIHNSEWSWWRVGFRRRNHTKWLLQMLVSEGMGKLTSSCPVPRSLPYLYQCSRLNLSIPSTLFWWDWQIIPKLWGACKRLFPSPVQQERIWELCQTNTTCSVLLSKWNKSCSLGKVLGTYKNLKDNNYVFNFREEILACCYSNVDILWRCCMQLHKLFCDITKIDVLPLHQ